MTTLTYSWCGVGPSPLGAWGGLGGPTGGLGGWAAGGPAAGWRGGACMWEGTGARRGGGMVLLAILRGGLFAASIYAGPPLHFAAGPR